MCYWGCYQEPIKAKSASWGNQGILCGRDVLNIHNLFEARDYNFCLSSALHIESAQEMFMELCKSFNFCIFSV